MSSYLKSFEVFVQNSDVSRAASLPDEEETEAGQATRNTVDMPKTATALEIVRNTSGHQVHATGRQTLLENQKQVILTDFDESMDAEVSISEPTRVTQPIAKPVITTNTTEAIVKSVANTSNTSNKMEHSYTRDNTTSKHPVSSDLTSGLTPARTILVRPGSLCTSSNTSPLEEHDVKDGNQVPVPTYNEIAAKEAMNECSRIANYVKNINSDEEDWEQRINKYAWSNLQRNLFAKVCEILDDDQLGRLANANRLNEPIQRRIVVDKSAARMRKALSSVAWDHRLTQWLHCLLMDYLPSTYMASYLDILQTLKTKLPALMDKMLFGRPLNVSQELLAPVMKKQWEPSINVNARKLTSNTVIVIVPTYPSNVQVPSRLQKWYQHFATITDVEQVTIPSGSTMRLPLHIIAEQIVSLTRFKIQEMRNADPTRNIVLVGFNAGAALALQIAMSETVSSVVCMGFAYNTLNGVRGKPDDKILDIKVPILFVIGQNSARTSTEEIESIREKMHSETSLVVVGCGDDYLRVPKVRRKIEGVTQSMIDTMIVDEVYDFVKYTIANPPGPRIPNMYGAMLYTKAHKSIAGNINAITISEHGISKSTPGRKRKQENSNLDTDGGTIPKSKYVPHVGRPRTKPIPNANTSGVAQLSQSSSAAVNKIAGASVGVGKMANQSKKTGNDAVKHGDINTTFEPLMGESDVTSQNVAGEKLVAAQKIVTNYELVPQTKMTPIKPSTLLTPLQKQVIVPSGQAVGTTSAAVSAPVAASSNNVAIGTKIKMIPANKFIQLKPPIQSQSKIYTIKTASMINTSTGAVPAAGNSSSIGSIVATNAGAPSPPDPVATGQKQIFTLKSPSGQTTQFVTASPSSAVHKYAVVKNNSVAHLMASASVDGATAKSQMDLSNIIDMPIVFADKDGNLTDSVAQSVADANAKDGNSGTASVGSVFKPSTTSAVNQLIISQQIIKGANTQTSLPLSGVAGKLINSGTYFIKKPIVNMGSSTIISQSGQNVVKPAQSPGMTALTPTLQSSPMAPLNKASKVIYINRNTMKPFTNIIPRSSLPSQMPKYTNLVVTNPRMSNTSLVVRPPNTVSTNPTVLPSVNLQALRPAGMFATNSTGAKTLQQLQIIKSGTPGGTTVTTPATTTALTALGDKPQIRGIVVKPGLKQLPTQLKSQLINRSVTVRKLVNIGTVNKPASVGGGGSANIVSTPMKISSITTTKSPSSTDSSGSMAATSGIQTSPKIITLNPVNPSTPVTQKND